MVCETLKQKMCAQTGMFAEVGNGSDEQRNSRSPEGRSIKGKRAQEREIRA